MCPAHVGRTVDSRLRLFPRRPPKTKGTKGRVVLRTRIGQVEKNTYLYDVGFLRRELDAIDLLHKLCPRVETPEGDEPPEWLEAVRAFVDRHRAEFGGGGGSQLTWTQRHEEYQEECEAMLEDLLSAASVDPTVALQKLCQPEVDAPGVTPLPPLASRPLRAFVDYTAFEKMMIDGL